MASPQPRGMCGFTSVTAIWGISNPAPGCHFSTRSDTFFFKHGHWNPNPAFLRVCQGACGAALLCHEVLRSWIFPRICAMCLPHCCRRSGLLPPGSSALDLRICHRRSKLQPLPATLNKHQCSQSTSGTSSMNSGDLLRLLWVSGLGEVDLESGIRVQHLFLGRKGSICSNGQERTLLWGSDGCMKFLRKTKAKKSSKKSGSCELSVQQIFNSKHT